MARLPQSGSDAGTWGEILNDFLLQTHQPDGQIKDNVITSAQIADGTVINASLDPAIQSKIDSAAPAANPTFTGTVTLTGGSGNQLVVDNGTLTVDATNHRVGIGTSTPDFDLSMYGTGSASTSLHMRAGGTGTFLQGTRSSGTITSPTASTTSNSLITMAGGGYTGTTWVYQKGEIRIRAGAPWTDVSTPTQIVFNTTPVNSTALSERMRIDSEGNVGIGTIAPSEALEVNGSIMLPTNTGMLKWSGGSKLYEQATRMIYQPNGDRFDVLNEAGSAFVASFNGSLAGLPSSIRFYNALAIGNAAGYAQSGSLPTDGLAVLGRVGIGNSTPAVPLDVTGEIRASTAGTNANSVVTVGGTQTLTNKTLNTPTFSGSVAFTGAVTTSGGGSTGVGTQTLASNLYVQSRGANLITNGSGLLGNNYNFSGLTFDGTDIHGGVGSFKGNLANAVILNDELIPIDITRRYRLVGWGKSGDTDGGNFNASRLQYLGVDNLDADGNRIGTENSCKFSGSTDTTLAAPLNPGDTTITLTNATGWYNGSTMTSTQICWYGYTNSKGYTYPDYTYTRNRSGNFSTNGTLGTWLAGGISGNVITLRVPWAGPALASGAAVRNAPLGATYKYIAASGQNIPNTWTRYEGFIGAPDGSGVENLNHYRAGTANIRILIMINLAAPADNVVRWSDLWFSELSASNLEPATATQIGTVTLSNQSLGAGDKYFSGKIGIGNVGPAVALDVTGEIRASTAGTNGASVVTIGGTQTLTNKTLTSPIISTVSNTGTITLPTATDTLVGRTTTDTLTNKRVTTRIGTVASSATPTPDSDANDQYNVTALAVAATISAPTGTPTDGQKLIIRVLDNGTARALTWNAIYRPMGVILPATTIVSKFLYVLCIYNTASTKWDVVSISQET